MAWWNLDGAITSCVAAYQPIWAADYASSKVNLTGDADYNCVDGSAFPTWDGTNGWKFDGVSSQYLSTGVTPTNGQTWSAVIRFTNNSKNFGRIIGTGSPTLGEFSIIPSSSNTRRYWHGGLLSISGALTNGVIGFAGAKAFLNGTAETGSIPTDPDAGTFLPVLIGGENWSPAPANFATVYVQAAAFYSSVITDEQMIAVMSAMLGIEEPVSLTAADFTLSVITFDTPTLEAGEAPIDLVANDFTLSTITFDAPTIEYNWNTPGARTFIVDSETRKFVIAAESRAFKIEEDQRAVLITESSESKYRNEITYNGLTGKDLTLAQVTFDKPVLQTTDSILLTFDDGRDNFYTVTYPLLSTYGIKATNYLIENRMNTGGFISISQANEMYLSGLVDFGNHTKTHPQLATLSQAEIENELTSCKTFLETNGLTRASKHVAYPAGSYNDDVLSVMAALGYFTGRTCDDGNSDINYVHDNSLIYKLKIKYIYMTTSLDTVKSWVDEDTTYIFLFHGIVETPDEPNEWSSADFEALLIYLKSVGKLTETISEYYTRYKAKYP